MVAGWVRERVVAGLVVSRPGVAGCGVMGVDEYRVGDRVRFTGELASDLHAGMEAVVVAIDGHPVFPLTVDVPGDGRRFAGVEALPVEVGEVEPVPDGGGGEGVQGSAQE